MNNTMKPANTLTPKGDAVGVSPVRILVLAAIAVALNLLMMWIGSAAGATLQVAAPEPVNALTVTLATALPLIMVGTIVWFLARRYTIRRVMGWVGLVFALVSMTGSFLAAADIATALTLSAMHVITGFAWFIALEPWMTLRPI